MGTENEKMTRVNFTISKKDAEELKRLAHENYMNLSEFIRFKTLEKK